MHRYDTNDYEHQEMLAVDLSDEFTKVAGYPVNFFWNAKWQRWQLEVSGYYRGGSNARIESNIVMDSKDLYDLVEYADRRWER